MVDPLTVARATEQIVIAAAPAIRRGRETVQASREIRRLLPDAIAKALCESAPEAPGVQAATAVVLRALTGTEMPEVSQRRGAAHALRRARSRVPFLRDRVPDVVAFGFTSFTELLVEWMAEALDADDEVGAAIRDAACPDGRYEDADIARRFGDAFFVGLARAPPTAWQQALLHALKEQDENRRWLDDAVRMRTEALASGAGGLLSGAAAVAAAQAAGASTSASLAAGGAAAVIAGGSVLVSASRERHRDSTLAAAVRHSVATWLEDLMKGVGATRSKVSERVSEAVAARWPAGAALPVPRDLLDELEGRLRRGANEANDEELRTLLYVLHDALTRSMRDPAARPEALDALGAVERLVASTGGAGR